MSLVQEIIAQDLRLSVAEADWLIFITCTGMPMLDRSTPLFCRCILHGETENGSLLHARVEVLRAEDEDIGSTMTKSLAQEMNLTVYCEA